MTKVGVYKLDANSVINLPEAEYFSSEIIKEGNQKQRSSFVIPLREAGLYHIEVIIVSEIERDSVKDFIIQPFV